MTVDELISNGNHFRSISEPDKALACYAQAFLQDPDCAAAYNNYGNVVREMGYPKRAYGFLQNAIDINSRDATAQFNLAVAYLLAGDLQRGWSQYESRWQYEHLAGTLPQFEQPRWDGTQDINGKTILVIGEQGHGDNIQFCRFAEQLVGGGANVIIAVDHNVGPLLTASFARGVAIVDIADPLPDFDLWTPIMSIPRLIGLDDYSKLPFRLQYLKPSDKSVKTWADRLGKKYKLRVGVCWSGRRDSWINQHKAIPFEKIHALVENNPEYTWYNLQAECPDDEFQALTKLNVISFPGLIRNWDDTAGLVHHLDVVISVDTSVGHLAGSLGRPWWLPLNLFGQDWRYLLKREDSPWYASCRIFRQPSIGNWDIPLERIENNLKLFKI